MVADPEGGLGIFPVGLNGEESGPDQLKTDIQIAIVEQEGVVDILREGQSDYLLKVATGELPGSIQRTTYWENAIQYAENYLDALKSQVYESYFDPYWNFVRENHLQWGWHYPGVEAPIAAWHEARENYIRQASANDSLYWYGEDVDLKADPADEGILGDTLIAAGIDTADCDDEVIEAAPVEDTLDTCIEQETAILTNWTTREINEVFFDAKRCLYCAVVAATGDGATTDCSDEYLNSFIGEGVNKIIIYYNKVESTDFYGQLK